MPVMKKAQGFAERLPTPLRGLAEALFPADELPLPGMMAVGGGKAAKGLLGLGKKLVDDVPATAKASKPMETLGEMNPEFTPVGGEFMYNQPPKPQVPTFDLYSTLMRRGMGGRGK